MTDPTPIDARTLDDASYAVLRRDMLSGRYAPTPVREPVADDEPAPTPGVATGTTASTAKAPPMRDPLGRGALDMTDAEYSTFKAKMLRTYR